MNTDDYEQFGSGSYVENYGLFSLRYADPRTLLTIDDPYRHNQAVEDRQYARHILWVICNTHKHHRVGLSPAQREETERLVNAFMMRRLDGIPAETVARLLKCSLATVYRDVALMTKWVRDQAELNVELQYRLKSEGDKISQMVWAHSLEGKQKEVIARHLKLKPDVVEKATVKIRRLARIIQKEFEAREKQNPETDDASDS